MDAGQIKDTLQKRLSELNDRAEDIDEDLSQPNDDDWSENATESEGDEVQERMGNMALDEIKLIKSALSKIELGTYGKCSSCSGSIDSKRLVALPYAATCVACS